MAARLQNHKNKGSGCYSLCQAPRSDEMGIEILSTLIRVHDSGWRVHVSRWEWMRVQESRWEWMRAVRMDESR